MTRDQLECRVRHLTTYAVGSTLLFLMFAVASFGPEQIAEWKKVVANTAEVDTLRVGHIKAERLDIVEPDGQLDLVMANTKRIPGVIVEGEELIDHREGKGIAGMIFYNAEGTEMGGLAFHSSRDRGGYEAFGHFAFDQYNQDQVVALSYRGTDSTRAAGLTVWDRPTSITIEDVVEAVKTRRSGTQDSTRLVRARRILQQTREETATRVFVGSENQAAGVHLYDTEGRERIRMVVDSLDRPQLVFLDKEGNVIKRFMADE